MIPFTELLCWSDKVSCFLSPDESLPEFEPAKSKNKTKKKNSEIKFLSR